MVDLIWLTIALPLAGMIVLGLFGKRIGEPGAGIVGTLTVAGSFGVAVAASAKALDSLFDENGNQLAHEMEKYCFAWIWFARPILRQLSRESRRHVPAADARYPIPRGNQPTC